MTFIYADVKMSLIYFSGIATITFMLILIVSPQASLAPMRFVSRLWKTMSYKQLKNSIDLVVLIAVASVTFSYFFGEARFLKLAVTSPSTIHNAMYTGKGVVLAQSDSATLILEFSKTGGHRKFIIISQEFLISETDPSDSNQF